MVPWYCFWIMVPLCTVIVLALLLRCSCAAVAAQCPPPSLPPCLSLFLSVSCSGGWPLQLPAAVAGCRACQLPRPSPCALVGPACPVSERGAPRLAPSSRLTTPQPRLWTRTGRPPRRPPPPTPPPPAFHVLSPFAHTSPYIHSPAAAAATTTHIPHTHSPAAAAAATTTHVPHTHSPAPDWQVENHEGVSNFDDILAKSDAIMVGAAAGAH